MLHKTISKYCVLLTLSASILSAPVLAVPFDKSSRYYPEYTHTSAQGTPSIRTSGQTFIYIRSGAGIYRLTTMSGGRYWAKKAWPTLAERIKTDHASSIIDAPLGTNPIKLIINGQEVSFDAAQLLGGVKGEIKPIGNGLARSSGGVEVIDQDASLGSNPDYNNSDSTALCKRTGSCGGGVLGSSSGGIASSSGSVGSSSGSGGVLGGSSSGGPVSIPPAPYACMPATEAATISPATQVGIAQRINGGVHIMAPGNYRGLTLQGKSFGGATLKCSEPGACVFGNTTMNEVSNLTLDGIKVVGGGVDIRRSQNITIRCSTFAEQTNTGVLLSPGGGNSNIQIDNNVFHNHKVGCNLNNKSFCETVVGGTEVANMDYGIRVYNATSVFIRNNIFGSLANHWISLKWGAKYTLIDNNKFNSCGRNCIELGQEPNTVKTGYRSVGEAMLSNNTLSGKANMGILIQNIEKATLKNNNINISGTMVAIPPNYKKCKESTGGCPTLGTGYPANRQIIRQ